MDPSARAVMANRLLRWLGLVGGQSHGRGQLKGLGNSRVSGLQRVRAAWGMLALALSLALVLSPALSRMHHVLHPAHGVAAMAAQSPTGQEVFAATERSALDRLFGIHAEGSQVCQLVDHTPCADGAAPALALALWDLPALTVPCPFNAFCAANTVAFFQARGPPALL